MKRKAEITQTILRTLDQCSGHALPEGTLREHLDIRLRPKVTDDEYGQARDWLKGAGAIKALPGQFGDPEPRWLITEAGKVLLEQ